MLRLARGIKRVRAEDGEKVVNGKTGAWRPIKRETRRWQWAAVVSLLENGIEEALYRLAL